jgi:hypothetical protein
VSPREKKVCFEFQVGFVYKDPGRTLFIADFDAGKRAITNLKAIANEDGNPFWYAYLGGPVYIPKIYPRSRKTWCFLSYEGLKLRQAASALSTVLAAAELAGAFSGIKTVMSNPFTTTQNPSNAAQHTRTPFAGKQIRQPGSTRLPSALSSLSLRRRTFRFRGRLESPSGHATPEEIGIFGPYWAPNRKRASENRPIFRVAVVQPFREPRTRTRHTLYFRPALQAGLKTAATRGRFRDLPRVSLRAPEDALQLLRRQHQKKMSPVLTPALT